MGKNNAMVYNFISEDAQPKLQKLKCELKNSRPSHKPNLPIIAQQLALSQSIIVSVTSGDRVQE